MNKQAQELDFELYFVTEVLGLRSLHYGFWDLGTASDQVGLEELTRAQKRFTEELISAIPEGVDTVLDVGSGIGDSSRALVARGYDVTAISPDRNHEQYYGDRSPGVRFHQTTFEAFDTDRRFDLLYFSESVNYIDESVIFDQSRRLTNPGAHLLVSGIFRSPDRQPYSDDFDVSDLELVRAAQGAGFSLVHARDITQNVLPTASLVHRVTTDHVLPFVEMTEMFLSTRTPVSAVFLKWALGPVRRRVDKAVSNIRTKMDPEYFATKIRYATLLFRKVA